LIKKRRVLDALAQAGRETAELGYITQGAQDAVSAPFFDDPSFFYQWANDYWRSEIDKAAGNKA